MTSTNNEQLIELVSNAQMAFFNGQYHEAFNLAQEAIKLDENCADAYQCAGDAYMSLGQKLQCNCLHIIIILLGVVVKYNCINSDYY